MREFRHYFSDIHFSDYHRTSYLPTQIGSRIKAVNWEHDSWEETDVVILGCGEQRGAGQKATSFAPDAIRQQLYPLHYWHDQVRISDAGNLLLGESIEDSYSSLSTVVQELLKEGKKVIILGGSHDLTLAQYQAYQRLKQLVDVAVIDSLIDLKEEEEVTDQGFLMEMLTGRSNFIRHFTHIGFQSYLVDPAILQTLDRLRFDCIRLGLVKEKIELVEPDLRSVHMLSIDMMAMKYADAPYLRNGSPNGLLNNELCELTKFAAMNDNLNSIGFYGYLPENDQDDIGAKAIAQSIWYLLDGWYAQSMEADMNDEAAYEVHHVIFAETQTIFKKSKRTGRWWMQMTSGSFIPCSYEDYIAAASDDLPERWLRNNERII